MAFTENIRRQLPDSVGDDYIAAGAGVLPQNATDDGKSVLIRQFWAIGKCCGIHRTGKVFKMQFFQRLAACKCGISDGFDSCGNDNFAEHFAALEAGTADAFQRGGQCDPLQSSAAFKNIAAQGFDTCGDHYFLQSAAMIKNAVIKLLQCFRQFNAFQRDAAGKGGVADALDRRRKNNLLQPGAAAETTAGNDFHTFGDGDLFQHVAIAEGMTQLLQGRGQGNGQNAHLFKAAVGNRGDAFGNGHIPLAAEKSVEGVVENGEAVIVCQQSAAAENTVTHIFHMGRQRHMGQMVAAGKGGIADGMDTFGNDNPFQQVAVLESHGADHFQTFRKDDGTNVFVAGICFVAVAENFRRDDTDTLRNPYSFTVSVIAQYNAVVDEQTVFIAKTGAAGKSLDADGDARGHFDGFQLFAIGEGRIADSSDAHRQHYFFNAVLCFPAVGTGAEDTVNNVGHTVRDDDFFAIACIHKLEEGIQKNQKTVLVNQRRGRLFVIAAEGVTARFEDLRLAANALKLIAGGEGAGAQIADGIGQIDFFQTFAAAKSFVADLLQITGKRHGLQFRAFCEGIGTDCYDGVRHLNGCDFIAAGKGPFSDFRNAVGNHDLRIGAGILDQCGIFNFKSRTHCDLPEICTYVRIFP